jgi:hypothetical protein
VTSGGAVEYNPGKERWKELKLVIDGWILLAIADSVAERIWTCN